MLCHLAVLSGFVFPLGGVLGPLLVWQLRKRELPEIEPHGKASLNFQLTVMLASAVLSVLWVLGFVTSMLFGGMHGSPFGFFPLMLGSVAGGAVLGLIHVAAWILAVIAAVKANSGEDFRYPFSIQFLK
jgi:uncharacterized protein